MYILAVFTRIINVDEARACRVGPCLGGGGAAEGGRRRGGEGRRGGEAYGLEREVSFDIGLREEKSREEGERGGRGDR